MRSLPIMQRSIYFFQESVHEPSQCWITHKKNLKILRKLKISSVAKKLSSLSIIFTKFEIPTDLLFRYFFTSIHIELGNEVEGIKLISSFAGTAPSKAATFEFSLRVNRRSLASFQKHLLSSEHPPLQGKIHKGYLLSISKK